MAPPIRTRSIPLDPTRSWYQHPLVVFIVPLLLFIGLPHLHNVLFSSPYTEAHEDARLQEIADLMGDIYSTLAEMTFIPHSSIKRGPHKINSTAIPCERSPAVLRLLELLPYVDTTEVQEPDWWYGGEFADYRQHSYLANACDPYLENTKGYHKNLNRIGLSVWGRGGWNGDQTWILDYDSKRHQIRIHNGDDHVKTSSYDLSAEEQPYDAAYARILYDTGDRENWHEIGNWWFDAPALLRKQNDLLRSGSISPWEASLHNFDPGWGVAGWTITNLLRKNGWPNSFDPDQFNADLIRAKHVPSQYGDAEDAYKRLEEMQDQPWYYEWAKYEDFKAPDDQVTQLEKQAANERDKAKQWVLKWSLQKRKWKVQQERAGLAEVQEEIERLCPDDMCPGQDDGILFEFRDMEKEYADIQYQANATSKCQAHMDRVASYASPDPDRLKRCIDQFNLEQHWLHLAYSQSKSEALDHCAKTGSTLLPALTPENRAKAKIAELEKRNVKFGNQISEMTVWGQSIPEYATVAKEEFQKELDQLTVWQSNNVKEIHWLEEQLAAGDLQKLWNCLERWECM